ncbi:MAG: hypothetical protein K6F08_01800 [bacterium]|nr:hypothetical protein [bacterium]
MDYGKIAYIKVSDLEKQLSLQNSNETVSSNNLSCFEFKNNQPQTFTEKVIALSLVKQESNSNICLFGKFNITAQSSSQVKVSFLINETIICTHQKTISGNDVIDISGVSIPVVLGKGQLSVMIESTNEITLENFSVIVLGAEGDDGSKEIELRACVDSANLAISEIEDGVIKYCIKSLSEELVIDDGDMQTFKSAKTHSISFLDDVLYIAYVDDENNLYLANNNSQSEIFVDSLVTSVTIGISYSDESIFIAYVSDGKAYYKVLKNGNLPSRTELTLPNVQFVRIVAVNSNIEKNYLIATDVYGNNYLCKSLIFKNPDSIIEDISFDTLINLNACVYAFSEKVKIESISAQTLMTAYIQTVAENTYDFNDLTSLSVCADFTFEPYVIPANAILYGVSFDTLSSTAYDGIGNSVYTDDCVGFTPASITITNNVPSYTDGGWDSRWPYNQIKPCVINSSGNITYLNPNAISYDLNGNYVDISNGTRGNVFVEIPKMYYRFHRTANDVLEFKLSSCKRFGFSCASHMYKGVEQEKIYVGAFATSVFSGKAWSLATQEKLRSNTYTTAQLRAFSYLNGNGYEMMNLNILNLLEMLFIIQFKSISYKESIGYGYCYNSSSGSLKTTGTSLSYPSRSYGYLTTNQKKVDLFLNIEGFCSFACFALDGVYVQPGKLGFMNVYGKNNNFIDDTNYSDYMFYNITFPTLTRTTKDHIVNNNVGLLPCEFYNTTSARFFDLFRSRFNAVGDPGSEYRMHFPNLGTINLGLFSYNFPLTTFTAGIQGHRLVYYNI